MATGQGFFFSKKRWNFAQTWIWRHYLRCGGVRNCATKMVKTGKGHHQGFGMWIPGSDRYLFFHALPCPIRISPFRSMVGQKTPCHFPDCHMWPVSAVKAPESRVFSLSAWVRSPGFFVIWHNTVWWQTPVHSIQSLRHTSRVHSERFWPSPCISLGRYHR